MMIITTFSLILLIGAGCAKNTTEPEIEINIPDNTTDITTTTEPKEPIDTGITLTGEAIGNNAIKLRWEVNDEIKAKSGGYRGYRLTEGDDPKMEYPQRYWFELDPDVFEHTWEGLPTGLFGIRACSEVDAACDVYSNDIYIDVIE